LRQLLTRQFLAIVALALLGANSVLAAVTQRDLMNVDVAPPANAALPLDLLLQDEDALRKPLQFWLGTKPSAWVLADYTCETLCGPVISIVSDALARSGLRPGIDFRLIVVGLDPKDKADDAARMKQAQIGNSEIAGASYFLRGNTEAISNLTRALGFSSVYDRDRDQFAHPAEVFVVAPDGRLARALSGLAVDPLTIRLAIVDAGRGVVGTWTDHIRLLCYGYDPASGTYSVAIGRILAAASAATAAVLMLLIGLLLRREFVERPIGSSPRRFEARSRTPTTD
jgi:protein SCO1/2